ncbi:MAG: YiiG family protein [Alphaproteobacteria bacterium]|nr:YiiG family protein [Alphaproteobacteria bacterium]
MRPIFRVHPGRSLAVALAVLATLACPAAGAEDGAAGRALLSKVDAAVTCLNALSEQIYASRGRYFSWASRSGPTGRERIIYGLHSIDNPSDCREALEIANDVAPHHPEIEAAGRIYVNTVTNLYPVVGEAERYYDQDSYKDDHMVRGKALHPLLVAGFDDFVVADQNLRQLIEPVNDARGLQDLAAIETKEGRNLHYHLAALLVDARQMVVAMTGHRDAERITAAIAQYETTLTALAPHEDEEGMDPMLLSNARSFLASSRTFMRRIRDHIPYDIAERAILSDPDPGSHWMVEGSPENLARLYNELVDTRNEHTASPILHWIPVTP